MEVSAKEMMQRLDLKPLPAEGGFYRETYRSTVSTAIYYLVTPDNFSVFHRIKSDEVFHFYAGDPVEMIQLEEKGTITRIILGTNILSGNIPQVVVPKGVWQALKLQTGGKWALMGTTVAPAFEFKDFELGERRKMLSEFPKHRESILKFTREPLTIA